VIFYRLSGCFFAHLALNAASLLMVRWDFNVR